jgi:hypothetical protein
MLPICIATMHTYSVNETHVPSPMRLQVTAAEGFGKTRLFEILDDLEAKTRPMSYYHTCNMLAPLSI